MCLSYLLFQMSNHHSFQCGVTLGCGFFEPCPGYTKGDKPFELIRFLELPEAVILFFFLLLSCFETVALWKHVAWITALPVLDNLNSVQHLQPRCLEDRFLPQQNKENKHHESKAASVDVSQLWQPTKGSDDLHSHRLNAKKTHSSPLFGVHLLATSSAC